MNGVPGSVAVAVIVAEVSFAQVISVNSGGTVDACKRASQAVAAVAMVSPVMHVYVIDLLLIVAVSVPPTATAVTTIVETCAMF